VQELLVYLATPCLWQGEKWGANFAFNNFTFSHILCSCVGAGSQTNRKQSSESSSGDCVGL